MSQDAIRTLDGSCKTGSFRLMPITAGDTACSVTGLYEFN